MPSATNDTPLTACPNCGYSLEGLPTEHRCPECGLGVDRRWRVFGRPGRGWYQQLLVASPVYAVLAAIYILVLFSLSSTLWLLGPLLAITFVGVAVTLYWHRPQSWVAIGPAGIQVYRKWTSYQTIDWSRFNKATSRDGRVVLVDPFGAPVSVILARNFDIYACIRAINEYPRPANGFTELAPHSRY